MQALQASGPFDTFTGLRVHALVVHAVVVLLPLTTGDSGARAVREPVISSTSPK